MAVIVGLVSQKGGVGKSTLARALGAVVAHAGLKVRIADLDPQQHTVVEWERMRGENRLAPPRCARVCDGRAGPRRMAEDELLILDAPARVSRRTMDIAKAADLIVQPTSGSLDDLRPAIVLFHELVQAGIPRERLVLALSRTLSAGRGRCGARLHREDRIRGARRRNPRARRVSRGAQPRPGRDGSEAPRTGRSGRAADRGAVRQSARADAREGARRKSVAREREEGMSDVDLSKLRKWIGKAKQIGEPPTPEWRHAQRAQQSTDAMRSSQFNVKVSASVKKRAKQLAARDDIQTRHADRAHGRSVRERIRRACPTARENTADLTATCSSAARATLFLRRRAVVAKLGVLTGSQRELVGLQHVEVCMMTNDSSRAVRWLVIICLEYRHRRDVPHLDARELSLWPQHRPERGDARSARVGQCRCRCLEGLRTDCGDGVVARRISARGVHDGAHVVCVPFVQRQLRDRHLRAGAHVAHRKPRGQTRVVRGCAKRTRGYRAQTAKVSAQHRSVGEVEAAIAGVLARPIMVGERVRGTVGALSTSCTKTTSAPPRRAPKLRSCAKNSRSQTKRQARTRATDCAQQIAKLRGTGGSLAPDPVGQFWAWLTRGLVTVRAVGFGLPLFFALMIETVSAFGPLGDCRVCRSDAATTDGRHDSHCRGWSRRVALRRGQSQLMRRSLNQETGRVVHYMADRTEPTSDPAAISIDELHADYERWCSG